MISAPTGKLALSNIKGVLICEHAFYDAEPAAP
jgi:hypothetical protein